MSAVYVESSALLAWLLGEPGSEAFHEQVDSADQVLCSVLSFLEAGRALRRAEHDGLLRAKDAQTCRGILSRLESSWMRMEIGAAVRNRAAQSFPVEPVRTLDAIHLATALEFVQLFPDLVVLSQDTRVRENCVELGFEVGP